jgi:hypothetical protein
MRRHRQDAMTRSDKLRRYGPWLLLALLAAAYFPRFAKEPMTLYPDAARCLLDNRPLQLCEVMFTYPPAFAFVMVPFVSMPMWLRQPIWYLITIGATILSYRLSELLARRLVGDAFSAAQLAWLRGLVLLLSFKFVLAVLENQSYDAFSFGFIVLGLAALALGRDAAAGAALGFAAAIKATPLVFFPYLLLKRRFGAAAAFALLCLAVSFSADALFTPTGTAHGYFMTWLREVAGASLGENPNLAKNVFWMTANPGNHSLRGAVSIIIDEFTKPVLHKAVLYGIYAAFTATVAALLIATRRDDRFIGLDGALLVIAMLMLSPMTSRSHYVVLILPYTVLVAAWMQDRRTRWLGAAVLAASFVLATATSNDLVGRAMTVWAYAHSFLVWGTVVLLIYFVVIVLQARHATAPVASRASPGGSVT